MSEGEENETGAYNRMTQQVREEIKTGGQESKGRVFKKATVGGGGGSGCKIPWAAKKV